FPMSAMIEAAKKFEGLEHRCQWVGCYEGVDWYNDSKATNVGAAKAAIEGIGESISGKIVLIAGGLGKDADFSDLALPISLHVKAVVLLGRDAQLLAQKLSPDTVIFYVKNLEAAVVEAKQQA